MVVKTRRIPAVVRPRERVEIELEEHEEEYLRDLTHRADAAEKGSPERSALVNEMYVFAELKHFGEGRLLTDEEQKEFEEEIHRRSHAGLYTGMVEEVVEIEVEQPSSRFQIPLRAQMELGEQPDRTGSRGGSTPALTLEKARELFDDHREAEMAFVKDRIQAVIAEKGEYHADDTAELQLSEPNIIGAAVSALVNGGVIESTGEHRRGSAPANHGRRSYVYRRKS